MTDNFLEYFLTNEYDEKVILKDSQKSYTVKDVKKMLDIKQAENENLACILDFINKTINAENPIIELQTSGSSSRGNSKIIKKSLQNLLIESNDLEEALKLGKNLEFISTTTMKHLFGLEFFLVLPINKGHVININRINYPEDINIKNSVLITTPSFLEAMRKYNAQIPIKPKVIMAAGAKLEDITFKYAQTISERVIDIYGSTETGTIGYRESWEDKLNLMRGIKILSTNEFGTKLSTLYSYENIQEIGDRIVVCGNQIELQGRCDRVLKIHEKRIPAEDIENEIKKNNFVEDCYCFEHAGKIAVLTVLSNRGREYIIENGTVEITKELKSFLKDRFEVIPQKWKFYDEIPRTQRGKIDKEKIRELFNLNLSLPFIYNSKQEKDSAEYELFFMKNSNFFQGHFDGFPILAGVVQLFYANFFIQKAFNIDCRCGQLRKIKFSNIIRPDKKIKLSIVKNETNVSFKYEDENNLYSSGVFPIKNFL